MIKLISDITVRHVQSMGGDAMVVAAAKVSTSGEEALKFAEPGNEEGNAGLINYLMKHRHGTPFEHAAMTFFVHAPQFVWWEWVRHRIGHSFNLESTRYKQLDPVFWIPRRDRAMCPVEGWKPGRPKFDTLDQHCEGKYAVPEASAAYLYDTEVYRNRQVCELAYGSYLESIRDGIAFEVAGRRLPSTVYFSGWVTINPRSCMAFLSLRTHDDTATFVSYPQAEIEEPARAIEAIFAEGWPITYASFNKNGRVAP